MHLKRSDLVGANCPFVRHERPAVGLLPQQPAAEPGEPAHIERRYGAGDGLAEQDRNLDSRQHREDAAWGLGVVKVPDEGGNQRPSGRKSGAIGGRAWSFRGQPRYVDETSTASGRCSGVRPWTAPELAAGGAGSAQPPIRVEFGWKRCSSQRSP
jgi:hypothetical protein